ncbi:MULTISPECIES: ABC transporter permease subunit [Anaerolinea]|uniref:ABC transporter permease protein n=1 Tax=Anaerolinea thermophila (strain DSM 14523 / JCM 11388 / NBRC 100420 / UNI-1) TaxID=926569 RepID=E8N628_ANATU|nr:MULTISPECIES: ABC transporter permease subunit [Anaerolinea]BAJ63892.1 putative ABC transporter permease protein [Anaerolinea thermophila UNI-1]
MRNIWIIARKEFKQFFVSPVAYAIALAIFLIMGVLFYATVLSAAYQQYAPSVQVILGPLATIFLFTTPAITMRTLPEEQRTGTLELLLTAPVRDWELVIGKWLGAMGFILTILLVTWVYPIILNRLVDPGIDQGILVSGYLGLVLMVAAFSAIGVAVGSLFSNQIAAFFTTLGVLLVLWMIGYPSMAGGSLGPSLLAYLDISEHFYPTFYRGIIDLKDIVYFISVIALALFLGSISVESRRWR